MTRWPTADFASVMATPTRNGVHKGPDFQGRGVAVIKMGEVYNSRFITHAQRDRLDLSDREATALNVEENDLLFCRTSLVAAGVGRCAIVRELNEPTVFASNIIRVRIDPHIASPKFYFYYFNSPFAVDHMSAIARGTTVTTITGPDLSALEVPNPSLPEQRGIAGVLGSLDDKIEQNRRTAAKLEALARATFRAWFVDFAPVHAKAAGAKGYPGLPPAAFTALPDRLNDSPIGPVPAGWEVVRWGDIATLEYGKSLRGYHGAEGAHRVYGTNGPIGHHTKALADGPGVIIGRKGAYRGVHYSPFNFWAIDTAFYLKQKRIFDWKWAYYQLLRVDINGMDSGSAIPSTSRDQVYSLPVCVPPEDQFSAFNQVAGPVFDHRIASEAESRHLAALRDYLLPRLLSGAVRVRGAEVVAEGVIA